MSTTGTTPMMAVLPSMGYSYTKTEFSSRSETDTTGWSESVGQNLSYEEQNTLAMELENITGKLITRLRNGLHTGLWESFITYATTSPHGFGDLIWHFSRRTDQG